VPEDTITTSPVAGIAKKIGDAIENWLTLDVITRVGDVDPSAPVGDPPTGGKCIRTRIRVLEGDIVQELDPAFVGDGEYASLVPGHEAQVEKAQKILKDTADMVIDLAKQVRDLLGEGS
jgi:hypothetical protein